MPTRDVWSVDIQYGFAALCIVLIGVLIWQIKVYIKDRRDYFSKIVEVVKSVTEVIDKNTSTIIALNQSVEKSIRINEDVRTKLQERPCLLLRMASLPPHIREALLSGISDCCADECADECAAGLSK